MVDFNLDRRMSCIRSFIAEMPNTIEAESAHSNETRKNLRQAANAVKSLDAFQDDGLKIKKGKPPQ